MFPAEVGVEATAELVARECLYRFLGGLFADPRSSQWEFVLDPVNQQLVREAADCLRAETTTPPTSVGLGELPVDYLDMRFVEEELSRTSRELEKEFDRVFGIVYARECPPYETEYHQSTEPFFRSQQLADIAGFYRAFGLEIAHRHPERPDHLSLELEFMALLAMKQRLALQEREFIIEDDEQAKTCEQAERLFFRDHLIWWVPSFAMGLRRKAGQGLYLAAGRILAAWLSLERARFDLPAGRLALGPITIEPPEAQAGCAEH
jgi:TorA maturation chaperone TorD